MRTKLFEIFGLKIYSFGAAICLSFMQAFWITRFLIGRDRRDPMWPPDASEDRKKEILEFVYDLGFGAMVGAIIGARLFHVLMPSQIRTYLDSPLKILYVWEGGLVFYGGFIGAFLTCFVMTLRRKLPPWQLGDFVSPAIAFGYAIGRLGCFMNGCCYGKPVAWGIQMTELHDHIPRHPTQIYESAAGFLTGFFLLWLLPRRTFRGQVFFLNVMIYAAARFAVEFVRDDPRGGLGPLSTSQWIALAAFPIGLAALLIQRRREPIPHPAGA